MSAALILGLWLQVATTPPPAGLDAALRAPDLLVAGAAAVDALRDAAREDDDAAAVARVQQALITGSRHPLVRDLARRARVAEHVRADRLAAAAADLDALGTPRTLWCVGPFDNTGGVAFAAASPVDDVAATLEAAVPGLARDVRFGAVEQEPRGGFDLDDQLVARSEVRVRCVVAARVGAPTVAALRLGGSGPIAAWHGADRRAVVISDADRSPGPDQVAGLVALDGRWSLIAIELALLHRGGVLDVRLTLPDGRPLRGLRWSTRLEDLRDAARRAAPRLPARPPPLVDWTVDPARFAEPGVARAAARVLTFTGAWDRRQRPDLPTRARAAQAEHAVDVADRADALIAAAAAEIDRDPSRARALLAEARTLEGLDDAVRADIAATTAALREAQGDLLDASDAWQEARRLAPARLDLAVAALSFERRRGVRGASNDRAILALAASSRHRPLLHLAADVLDERGDVEGALGWTRRSGDLGVAALREAHIAEARLGVDTGARDVLVAALRRRLASHPASHGVAERLALLGVERRSFAEVDGLLADRRRRYPARPEPLRLAARVALLRGDRSSALAALQAAQQLTPDDGDLQRAIRALRDDDDALVRRLPTFDDTLLEAARRPPPRDALIPGAFVHHKVIATRFHDNGNLARVEDLVVVIVDARRAAERRAFSFGYSGGREQLEVLAAERIGADGRRESPEQVLDRGQEGKENGAYSDARSKTVQFANVDDGDILHVRIRRETIGLQNQFGDFFGDIELLDGPLPVRRFEMSIEGPRSRPLAWDGRGAPTPEIVEGPETTLYRFVATDLPALIGEPGMPPWMEVARFISVSTYDDVAALGTWYEALIADQLRLDDTLRAVVAREKAAATDTRDLVRRLYEHVVTETRYVGIELGIHGWKPYPVTEVYRRRFGDCKDKASLLVALLREAGVPAHIALVRTMHLGHAATSPPSMWTFNHAIAWVEPLDLFLDGTAERSGLMELPAMDQGAAALIVDGPRSRLVTIPVAPATANDNTSSYVLRLQRDGALVVDGREAFSGTHAARERQRFEDAATWRQTLERELAQGIPGAQVTAIEVSDLSLARDVVGYRFQATLPRRADVAADGSLVLPVSLYPHDLVGSYAEASSRRFDLFVDHPWRTRNVMRYVLPDGMTIASLPEGGSIETPHLRFRQVITRTPDGFVVDEDTAILSRRIPVGDYPAFRDAALAADQLMKRRLRIVPAGAAP
jgi:tetratricopeptide (TPR) repeat protein